MEINVGKDYTIKSSNLCWTLYENKLVKSGAHEGTVNEIACGDHMTLRVALARVMDYTLRDVKGDVTLEQVIKHIDDALAVIVSSVAEVDAANIFRRGQGSGKAASVVKNDNSGLYKMPGKIAEVVPGLEIISRNRKGRGETIVINLDTEEKRAEFVAVVREQLDTCVPALKIIYKRALEVIGE